MSRRVLAPRWLAVLALACLLTACGAPAQPAPAPAASSPPAAAASPPAAPSAPVPATSPAAAAPAPASSPAAAAAPASGARTGGQVVFAYNADPFTWIPFYTPASQHIYFAQFVYDGLTRPDDQLRPMPSLAESWEVSPDGLTYTFKLRRGVKFHDGQTLTSADVKWTWEATLHGSNKAGAQIAGFFSRLKGAADYRDGKAESVAGITTPDDLTVRAELATTYAPFLSISAFQPILPKHVYGTVPIDELEKSPLARRPVGTGPFKLTDWRPNDQISFAAHEDYWAGRPKLDTLICKLYGDPSALLSAMRSGALDVMGMYATVPPVEYDSFKNDPNLRLVEMPGYNNYYTEFNLTNPLFEDVRVRRALVHAIDRQSIIKDVLLGHGKLINAPIHPNSWGYSEPQTTYEYSPDKAKALLSEAGWTPGPDGILQKDGKRFSFELLTFPSFEYPQVLQEQWRQVGVEAKVNAMDFAALWGPIYLARKHEAIAIHVIYGIYTDPDYPLGGYFHSRLNRNSYKNPKVDELIERATAVVDPAERKRLYAEFIEEMARDVPHFWVGSPDEVWAHSAKVKLPDKKLGFLMLTNLKDWERLP